MAAKTRQKRQYIILQVLQLCRWIALIVLALSFPVGNPNSALIIGLAAAVALYNAVLYLPVMRSLPEEQMVPWLIAIDFMWACAFMFLTDGVNSPYYFFMALSLLTFAFWYGRGKTMLFGIATVFVTLGIELLSHNFVINDWRRTIALLLVPMVVGILVNSLTMTQRSERQLAIRAGNRAEGERNRLLSLINSMADAVIATDKKGTITHFNSAALGLLDTNAGLVGKQVTSLFHFLDDHNQEANLLKEASKQTTPLKRDDLQMVNGFGETVQLYVSISPIAAHFGHDKAEEGYIFLLRDITKEKSLEQQRTEFISVASHELRTPLAIAEANISTALMPQAGKIDDVPRGLLEQAHQNIVYLGKLVSDLTMLAAAERDLIETDMAVVDAAALVQDLASNFKPQAEQRGLKLDVTIENPLPTVVTSASHVREILQNFVTNALKYTKTGGITIRAQASPQRPENLLLSVTDTGIGISTSDQKHLFQKFYRSEDYRTRETGGTGLGLYITTKLAERLNAQIHFESKLDHGSTFYLEVPPYSRLKRDQSKVVKAQMDNIISSI